VFDSGRNFVLSRTTASQTYGPTNRQLGILSFCPQHSLPAWQDASSCLSAPLIGSDVWTENETYKARKACGALKGRLAC